MAHKTPHPKFTTKGLTWVVPQRAGKRASPARCSQLRNELREILPQCQRGDQFEVDRPANRTPQSWADQIRGSAQLEGYVVVVRNHATKAVVTFSGKCESVYA